MRNDAVGLWWDDTPPPKPPKAEKAKRSPPDPIWLAPDYLPGLDEARRFPVRTLTLGEMRSAVARKELFVFDVEVYPNYFLVCFTSMHTGHVFYLDVISSSLGAEAGTLQWILENARLVGFNSISYDLPICAIAVAGASTFDLQEATDQIIKFGARPSDVMKTYKAKAIKADHIDLIEVAPLQASLKAYAGRLHAPRMQDLPFAPGTRLSLDQIEIVRWYCVNDTTNTAYLYMCLEEHIALRAQLGKQYGVELRSKSDAQIAEAVISHELQRITRSRPIKPVIPIGTSYQYKIPHFLKYQSPLMQSVLETVRHARFVVDESGSIGMPPELASLKITIDRSTYQMGLGGLHSCESTVAYKTDKDHVLIDRDVTSYYPFIILNLGLAPQHLGQPFLKVYRSIVDRRLLAKRAGNKVEADSLKIVVNGSFGKLGSKYSMLYSPDLLTQVTLTGQLSLLMLIERLAYAGINVVSGNTDGVVSHCPRSLVTTMEAIVKQWEQDTGFETEETRYLALYSKDVNNYLAVKQKFADGAWQEIPDGVKGKGAYANPWSQKKNPAERLHKNPTATICVEAVTAYLSQGALVEHTVRACTDITKFLSVRSVKGGAVKIWGRTPPPQHRTPEELVTLAGFRQITPGAWIRGEETERNARYISAAYAIAVEELSGPSATEYVGKTVRWYYAKGVEGEFVYALNGNKVPRSDGAKPLMQLPEHLPSDLDFDWYITEAVRILEDIAAIPKKQD